eukprot:TRINITY_DN34427_c0_g1_i1.p1 TRINITY_DN34427_c0_g1~~TRINITY_DN34427_c0_g1_i1.p1  ORF type:complete len:778 (-),score=174.62 TRINITY_DN34427_c0_g1_i1:48-2381(-)
MSEDVYATGWLPEGSSAKPRSASPTLSPGFRVTRAAPGSYASSPANSRCGSPLLQRWRDAGIRAVRQSPGSPYSQGSPGFANVSVKATSNFDGGSPTHSNGSGCLVDDEVTGPKDAEQCGLYEEDMIGAADVLKVDDLQDHGDRDALTVTSTPAAKNADDEDGVVTWLRVVGVPRNVTSRELHVLFSGCRGHLSCRVQHVPAQNDQLREGHRATSVQALVSFRTRQDCAEAMRFREGTTWSSRSYPVGFEIIENAEERAATLAEGLETDQNVGGGTPRHPTTPLRSSPAPRRSPTTPSSARGNGLSDGGSRPSPTPLARSVTSPSSVRRTNNSPRGGGSSGGDNVGLGDGGGGGQLNGRGSGSRRAVSMHQQALPVGRIGKEKARMTLESAIACRQMRGLELAIATAREAGLGDHEIAEAEETLTAMEWRISARQNAATRARHERATARLNHAVEQWSKPLPSAKRMQLLKSAISGAKAAGLQEEDYAEALALVDVEEEKLRAEVRLENLLMALTAGPSPEDRLRWDCNGCGLSNAGKAFFCVFCDQPRRNGATAGPGPAVTQESVGSTTESPPVKPTPSDLREAIQDARDCGVEEATLHRAAFALVALERRQAARTNLQVALKSSRGGAVFRSSELQQQLIGAFAAAKAAGLDEEEIGIAREAFALERRSFANTKLEEALQCREIKALETAISEGQKIGADPHLVEKAQRMLEQQEFRVLGSGGAARRRGSQGSNVSGTTTSSVGGGRGGFTNATTAAGEAGVPVQRNRASSRTAR